MLNNRVSTSTDHFLCGFRDIYRPFGDDELWKATEFCQYFTAYRTSRFTLVLLADMQNNSLQHPMFAYLMSGKK